MSTISNQKSSTQSAIIHLLTSWSGSIIGKACPIQLIQKPIALKLKSISMNTLTFESSAELPMTFLDKTIDYQIDVKTAAILVKDQKPYTWTVQITAKKDIRKTANHPAIFEYEATLIFESHRAFSAHYQLVNQLSIQQMRKQTLFK